MASSDETSTIDAAKPEPNLGAVVLCGGKSSRLGIDKTQLVFHDRTFLERVVHQVGKVTKQIVLVGGIDFQAHRLPGHLILKSDEDTTAGPLEGIRVGLKTLSNSCERAFVTSCDVPLIKPELIRYLDQNLQDRNAIVPFQDQRIFGMTAIYRTSLYTQIQKLIEAQQLRVSDLAAAFDAKMVDVKELTQVDLELDSMTNVNSADDYFDLLKRFGIECDPELKARLQD